MKKKKVLIFDLEKMQSAGKYINAIQVVGVNNIRALSELSYILDSGTLSEIEVKNENIETMIEDEVKTDESD